MRRWRPRGAQAHAGRARQRRGRNAGRGGQGRGGAAACAAAARVVRGRRGCTMGSLRRANAFLGPQPQAGPSAGAPGPNLRAARSAGPGRAGTAANGDGGGAAPKAGGAMLLARARAGARVGGPLIGKRWEGIGWGPGGRRHGGPCAGCGARLAAPPGGPRAAQGVKKAPGQREEKIRVVQAAPTAPAAGAGEAGATTAAAARARGRTRPSVTQRLRKHEGKQPRGEGNLGGGRGRGTGGAGQRWAWEPPRSPCRRRRAGPDPAPGGPPPLPPCPQPRRSLRAAAPARAQRRWWSVRRT
jgi:hypothetical protein